MADLQQKYDLDLRFGGSTLGDFGQFYDVELPYLYKCLNAIRRNQVSPAGESVEAAPYQIKVEDDKFYIRDSENQDWVFIADVSYRGGLYAQGESLLKNTDKAGNTAQTRANKVAVYDEDGNLPADITGSTNKLVGKSINVTGIEDGQVLVYSSVDDKWIPGNASAGVGAGKTLTIHGTGGTLAIYNGGATTSVEIPVSVLMPNTTYTYGMMAQSIQLPSNVALVCVQAGTTGATIGTLSDQEMYTIGTAVFQRVYLTPKTVLLRNQAVAAGDIRYAEALPSYLYLECTTAGITGSSMPNFTGITEGAVITDGTATWTVRKFSGMSGTIAVSDNTSEHTGTATNVNANGATVLPLPATIKATVDGNASTATKLQTARSINGTNFDGSANLTTSKWGTARNVTIKDADSTNSGAAVSVDGSGPVTLNLPSTIKASLTGNVTGNVTGSSGSCTGNSATATKVNGKTILTVNSFSGGVLDLSTFS